MYVLINQDLQAADSRKKFDMKVVYVSSFNPVKITK